tara:strand:- start:427 stop:603 length:177 start_codon:yes stop_codon:yes gene_type:complete
LPPLKTEADYVQWKYNLEAFLEMPELLDLVNVAINVPGAQFEASVPPQQFSTGDKTVV